MGRNLKYGIGGQINPGEITDAMLATQPKGYAFICGFNTYSPLDATTYYFGLPLTTTLITTINLRKIKIPKAGTITKISIRLNVATILGTSEASTLYIRLNNTTDYEINAIMDMSATIYSALNTTISIPVIADDEIELKWITPTWATNPTGVSGNILIYLD